MNSRVALTGRYVVGPDKRIEPDEDGKRLLRKQQSMLLLVASGRAPDFYFDPADGTYWESVDYEDGQMTLRPVTREYIEQNWPNVNPDKRIEVRWPVRY
jgi:hypothetical protein